MSRILIILSCLLVGLSELKSQVTFSKTYNLEEDIWVRGREIDLYEDHIYVLTGKVCPPASQCGDIVKMDYNGNIIWKREIGAFDIGNTNSVWINNDTITITGHRNSMDQPFGYFIQQMTTDNDSLTNYVYPIDTNVVGNAFNYGTYYHNNNWYLYGTGKALDGSVDAVLMKVNQKGELVDSRIWDDGYSELQVYDLKFLNNQNMVYMAETKSFGNGDFERHIFKLDPIGLESARINLLPIREAAFSQLIRYQYSGGNYICLSGAEFIPQSIPSFFILDENGIQGSYFEFDHQIGVDIKRFITNMITASNGDIVGVGNHRFVGSKDTGWMFRMSPNGELLWETTFKSQDWDIGDQIENNLNDIVELDDGSFIAVGWQDETTDNQSLRDLWVMRVGPDGCLYEDGCDFGQFTTSVDEESLFLDDIRVYPNPVTDLIQVDFELNFDKIVITQLDGRIVMKEKFQQNIDVSLLERGMYVIQFLEKGRVQSSKKFIKL